MKTLRVSLLSALILPFASTLACHDRAAEPAPQRAAATDPARPTAHDIHHIIESDHRNLIHLAVDDKIMLPNDPAFDWHAEFEDKGSFEPFAGDAGHDASAMYRAAKAGLFRMMVYGDPKCLAHDAHCGLSKRRWDITAEVK